MDASTLTRKGQVTIPAAIRAKLGLRAGDRVAFVEDGGSIVVKPVQNDIKAAFGLVKARRSASLKDFEAAIRTRATK